MNRRSPFSLLAIGSASVIAAVSAPPAAASEWWPHPADASWTYTWSDSAYAQTPTKERVTVKEQRGNSFTLAWTTEGLENAGGAITSVGSASFSDTNAGIVNTDWSSTLPPAEFPVLCAQRAGCGNALTSTLYYLIWGSRDPMLAAPLLEQTTWSGTGGASGDVSSVSRFEGVETVRVPAFPDGVPAVRLRSDVTQAGAQGDPYGSGVRTVWWVYGVGPVKVVFQHAGGVNAPITSFELQSTTLAPKTTPSTANYFAYQKGVKLRYRLSNTRYMTKPSLQEMTIDAVVNGSARFVVKSVSGPIKVAATYGYSTRADGVVNLWGQTQAATRLKFPPLGPASAPADRRRHFFTPFDLMNFGLNPIIPAYPAVGDSWKAVNPSRDFSNFGVEGRTRTLGLRRVTTPAGTFTALAVQSTLRQPGFLFGTGTRTSYFASGKGLVKLVFAHADHSVTTVQLVK